MAKFTVWVQQANGRGTTHVSSHEANTVAEAKEMALGETCADWGDDYRHEDLHVLGVAVGDVELIEWTESDALEDLELRNLDE